MNIPEWRRFLAPALVCTVLGLVMALQMKTQVKIQLTLREKRGSEAMLAQFQKVAEERDRLRTELDRLHELASLRASAVQLQQELDLELAAAGLLEVLGPGVIVTLTDQMDGTPRKITADDIMLVLNELRAGGAEALAINGERVTARLRLIRADRSAGTPLRINQETVTGPVHIAAVGDPEALASSIQMRGGVASLFPPWVRVEVKTASELVIAAAPEPLFDHGRPVR